MAKKRKGKAVKKNKTRNAGEEDAEVVHAPHSFVIHRGKTGKYVQVGSIEILPVSILPVTTISA